MRSGRSAASACAIEENRRPREPEEQAEDERTEMRTTFEETRLCSLFV